MKSFASTFNGVDQSNGISNKFIEDVRHAPMVASNLTNYRS